MLRDVHVGEPPSSLLPHLFFFFFLTSRNPRLPQLQPLSAWYNLINKIKPKSGTNVIILWVSRANTTLSSKPIFTRAAAFTGASGEWPVDIYVPMNYDVQVQRTASDELWESVYPTFTYITTVLTL